MQRLHIENSQADVLILHKDSDTYIDILRGDGEWEEGRGGRHCGVQQTCHRNDSLLSLLVGINIPSIIQKNFDSKRISLETISYFGCLGSRFVF